MRRQEIAAAVAVVLYIVFFSTPPPAIVSAVLNNVIGMVAAVAGAVYVTLYQSKLVGGLLLLTLVMSISRGAREGLTVAEWSAATMYKTGDMMTIGGKTYVALHDNDHMGSTDPEFTTYWRETTPPAATPPPATTPTPPPATTPTPPPSDRTTEPPLPPPPTSSAPTSPPIGTGAANGTAPVMSCNLESYANYKRSGQTEFAAF